VGWRELVHPPDVHLKVDLALKPRGRSLKFRPVPVRSYSGEEEPYETGGREMSGQSRPVRIAYAAVDGGRGFAKEALREVDARHRTLLATVAALAGRKIDLLVFPAGYF